MINRVVLVGRLTKDPELTYTPSGLAVSRFTIAVNRPFSNQQGEREADYIQCIAWRKQAENLANFMKKGGLVGVDGRIQTGSYEGQDGKRVYTTEVVADSIQFLESKGGSGAGQAPTGAGQAPTGAGQAPTGAGASQTNPPQHQAEDQFAQNKGPIDVSEDDLPF